MVLDAGHKVKRLVLQCINGVSSNPVEGRTKSCQLKDSNTIWFNVQTYIYIYMCVLGLIFRRIYIRLKIKPNSVRIFGLYVYIYIEI